MKKSASALLAVTLGLTAVLGVNLGQGHAESAEKGYLLVFKQESNLPVDYQNVIEKAGGKVKRSLKQLGAVSVTSSNPNFLAEIQATGLVQDAGVEKVVEPEAPVEKEVFNADFAPTAQNDLYNQFQWDIKQVTDNGASWNLPGGTGKSVDGKDIVVAVVDTGIDYNHPDIKANYAYGKSFVQGITDPGDGDGHGTHVAGSIAGNGRVLGVGPQLKVASYRVFAPGASAYTSDIAAALMTAADDNVDVVNMSLGGYDWFQDPATATKDVVADVRLFNRAITYAVKKGVTVVGSAGNAGSNITSPGGYSDDKGATHRSPSSQLLIRTSSNGVENNLAYYSNYGVGKIDVAAPGGDYGTAWLATGDRSLREPNKRALSTVPGGYAWYIGTSMAAPKTAALAGVVIAKHGKDVLSPSQVKHIIQTSAVDLGKTGYDAQFGHGRISAVNALK